MRRLAVLMVVAALALAGASGASAAFRYHAHYPGIGPVLSGGPVQVRAASRVCRARPAACYRAITPRAAFARDCRRQHIGPARMARLLSHMKTGAAFITYGYGWWCLPIPPEEIVY